MPLITRRRTALALAAALPALAAGCGGGSGAPQHTSAADADAGFARTAAGLTGPVTFGTPARGGTFRAAGPDLVFSAALDPTAEYSGFGWGILHGLLVRPLLGYSLGAGDAGNRLRPDLAEALPEVSADGRTYTVHLRHGVRFAPPVSREVTAGDVVTALERVGTPSVAAQYGFYYDVIQGMDAFRRGKARTISGITAPDRYTLRIHLLRATPEFPYRLALPATAPIPREVSRCHTGAGEYGRYLIATGPYMIHGSDRLAAACAAQHPIDGFRPGAFLRLVRNPAYDPATDDTTVRPALPDAFTFSVDSNPGDIHDRIVRGDLETETLPTPPKVIRAHLTDPATRTRLRVNASGQVNYLVLNLTEPPFDDVHVRRALALALDLQAVRRSQGGILNGPIATHILPDSLLPMDASVAVQKPPYRGDTPAAHAEMARSRYDRNHDGRCDGAVCQDVLMVTDSAAPLALATPVIRQAASVIGVHLRVQEVPFGAAASALQTPARRVALSPAYAWAADYGDPSTFVDPLLTTKGIAPSGASNVSLLGITPALARSVHARVPTSAVPSIDSAAAECAALAGAPRKDCYARLDRHVTRDIVPMIPLLQATVINELGPAVTRFDFDQSSGFTSWARVAVDPSKQGAG
ncbi:MAG: ABC transporter substrate-binding protein [Thermoleophilia bacterium]